MITHLDYLKAIHSTAVNLSVAKNPAFRQQTTGFFATLRMTGMRVFSLKFKIKYLNEGKNGKPFQK